jgi:preprotein translocase subunit SecF
MTRSVNTVLTVIVVVVAILIFGASSLFNFSLAFHKGTAINTEENTPDTNPINNANEKLNKLDAPNIN